MNRSEGPITVAARWTALVVALSFGFVYWMAVPVLSPDGFAMFAVSLVLLFGLRQLFDWAHTNRSRPGGPVAASGGLVAVVASLALHPAGCPAGAVVPRGGGQPSLTERLTVDVFVGTETIEGIRTPVLGIEGTAGTGCATRAILPLLLLGYGLVFAGVWYHAVTVARTDSSPTQCHSTPK